MKSKVKKERRKYLDKDGNCLLGYWAGDIYADEVLRLAVQIELDALGILKNAAEAEEVAQETFLSAFEHLDGFRGDAYAAERRTPWETKSKKKDENT